MSFTNAFARAGVFCWLSTAGVLDAVQNRILVSTSVDRKFARFDVIPAEDQWARVFQCEPEPIADDDGDISSVELVIGRSRENQLYYAQPYNLNGLVDAPEIQLWEMPIVTTTIGDAPPLDICPGLDGLLDFETQLIEIAASDRRDLEAQCEKLIVDKWLPWATTYGVTSAGVLLEYVRGLRSDATRIAKGLVPDVWKQEQLLAGAIERARSLNAHEDRRVAFATLMGAVYSVYVELFRFHEVLGREKQKANDLTDAEEWAHENGSSRLRKAADAGVLSSAMGVYRDERLALDRPGWEWWKEDESPLKGFINPSETDLDSLMKAKKLDPEASLSHIPKTGKTIVVSKFLGRYIIRETILDEAPF